MTGASSSSSSYTDLMRAAEEVARRAGEAALKFFRQSLSVESKADGSPVTVADRTAERVAREWIEARYPADGILGEELGETRSGAPRRWILDPIDGTASFIRGVPLWGTLVGIVEGGRAIAGAAFFPAVDELLVAQIGKGCFWNGQRARVSEERELARATVLATDPRMPHGRGDRWRALAAGARVARTWGDCYGYLLVATGRAEVMVDGVLATWDAAALQPIIEEAGGVFTDWSGRAAFDTGSAIATNAALAREARLQLLDPGAKP